MSVLDRIGKAVKSWVSFDAFVDRTMNSEGYICAACRDTFKQPHAECPTCGSQILVPQDQAGNDGGGQGPFSR